MKPVRSKGFALASLATVPALVNVNVPAPFEVIVPLPVVHENGPALVFLDRDVASDFRSARFEQRREKLESLLASVAPPGRWFAEQFQAPLRFASLAADSPREPQHEE
jgi:hypothetical protein